MDLSDNFKYSTVTTVLPLDETIISFLVIINTQSADVGTYTCEAQNVIGTDQSSGVLTVNGKYAANQLLKYIQELIIKEVLVF